MNVTRRDFILDFIRGSAVLGGALLFPSRSAFSKKGNRQAAYPAYAVLENKGELAGRIKEAYAVFEACRLCPRECGVNRIKGEQGFCRTSATVKVNSVQPHFGEERSLVGKEGSGTIFFSSCNLRCVFCQNWPIAHKGYGNELTNADLADRMLHLQKIGCHNVNLVTPTHVMPNILSAVRIACKKGLKIPLVYNTSGYERAEIIKLLDGIVDIYLPDMKYMDPDKAAQYSAGVTDYPETAKEAIMEMNRQVGRHRKDKNGVAVRGLMIRHLVMPHNVAGTEKFARWVAESLSASTYVNIMHQYHPEFKAADFPEINRRITIEEYLEALSFADRYGLTNLDPGTIQMRKYYRTRKKLKFF